MFFIKNPLQTICDIQNDVDEFVKTELAVYLSRTDSDNIADSVITNIALFDIDSINTEHGYTQISRLLGNHYDQMIERRMRQFLHSLYIKYSINAIEYVKKRVIKSFLKAYPNVRKENINALNNAFNTFWLVPFIKESYNTIVLNSKK